DLKGTLILPAKAKKFKLLIIQAGSGPTDRNGNSGKAVTANSYRLLAEALAAKNIATLLIDKRGVAGSMAALKSELILRFDDYADDLAAWAVFIKKDKRVKKVFIAGHSEGSLVGMIAAQKEKVNGYISIAGAGESIDKIITWQYKQQLPKAGLVVDSLFTRMKNKQPLDTVPPYLLSLFRPSVQPYILSWMLHDPCEEIKKLSMPVLIIQGSTDIQVTMKQATLLKECKPSATLKVIEGMNHILKQAPEDRMKNIATYTDEKLPLSPELISSIVTFVSKS
ncbi:MAG: alpha/beta hydrolase, partial [Ferruginibacter sp.]|nr:alpha/beta hydrolase [Ferruginibacter sp.]